MLLLADEFFCIAHDDRTGRPRRGPREVALGLAAGLLGELILMGRITIVDGAVRVTHRDPPPDALAHNTLATLLGQPQHTDVQTWLAYLAVTATDSVLQRLVLAGMWRREERRRLGRTRISCLPVDANKVAARTVRLDWLLTSNAAIEEPDAMLAGLVAVTGLADHVVWRPEVRAVGLTRLSYVVAALPWPLYRLLTFTEAAVGDAALSPR